MEILNKEISVWFYKKSGRIYPIDIGREFLDTEEVYCDNIPSNKNIFMERYKLKK